jgi:UDP-N-acetylmuramate--alanine ligase
MAGVTSALIGDQLAALPGDRTLVVGPTREGAVASTAGAARRGDLVLVVGAGDVTALAPLVLDALRERDAGDRS